MAKSDVRRETGKVELNRQQVGDWIASHVSYRKFREEKAKEVPSDDTILRRNIHKDIKEMLAKGIGKVEILVALSNKYIDTYLSKFFEQWIEFHIEKKDYLEFENKDDQEIR